MDEKPLTKTNELQDSVIECLKGSREIFDNTDSEKIKEHIKLTMHHLVKTVESLTKVALIEITGDDGQAD